MSTVQRVFQLFRNSPTFGRDRANLISGFTIGTTALALNAAILIMVLPLMLDPNDRDFQMLTQNIEFGQLLGLIPMGGATAFASVLIPMRLSVVFMGPRIGRYFDQIVLSGISPLKFLIGKVTSQNLFLALVLFLLLPWFVLVLALGGLHMGVFLGNLILVWLYCMMLAMVMLWLSLYLNEIFAMLVLIYFAVVFCAIGCAPIPGQPFVITPFPALMHSVYVAVEASDYDLTKSYFSVFGSCVLGMSVITGIAFTGVYLGPLYGIVRDNSTFGEVVKPGDSRRKRRFRFRLHIQRSSEIAFFYENRGTAFRRYEGLLRWTATLLCLLIPVGLAWYFLLTANVDFLSTFNGANRNSWWVEEFHFLSHMIHGISLVFAVFLFSHARNTFPVRLAVLFGWKPRVSRLDWMGFLLFLCLSTVACIGIPLTFDAYAAETAGATLFPLFRYGSEGTEMDYLRVSLEGTLVLSLAALTVYLMQRMLCTYLWMKSLSLVLVACIYAGLICILPAFVGIFSYEMLRHPDYSMIREAGQPVAAMSPAIVLMNLYKGSPQAWHQVSSLPFYVLHTLLITICFTHWWKRSRKLNLESDQFQIATSVGQETAA